MPKPVPRASDIGPCPLRTDPDAPLKHLAWRDTTGWVVVYGTPKVWSLVAAGLPCWHMAIDAVRTWIPARFSVPAGWASAGFRHNMPLDLPDGQSVCDVCWGDLTGGAP